MAHGSGSLTWTQDEDVPQWYAHRGHRRATTHGYACQWVGRMVVVSKAGVFAGRLLDGEVTERAASNAVGELIEQMNRPLPF